MKPFRLILAIGLFAATLPGTSHADAPVADTVDDSALAKAERAFTNGEDLAEALRLFRAAYQEQPSWRALNGAALSLEALGRHVEAFHAYEQLLAQHEQELDKQRIARVRQRIRDVSARIARVRLIVKQPGVRVRANGEQVLEGPGTKDLWLQPGAVSMEARGDGFEPYVSTLRLEPGERQRLRIALAPLEQPKTRPPVKSDPTPEAKHPSQQVPPSRDEPSTHAPAPAWVPWALAGAGVTFGVVGTLFLLQSDSDFEAFDESVNRAAPGTANATTGDADLLSSGERNRAFAITGFVLSGLAATGAIVLFALPDRSATQVGANLPPTI